MASVTGLRNSGRTSDGRFQVYNPEARRLEYRDSWDDMSEAEQAWFRKRHPDFTLGNEVPQAPDPDTDFEEPEHISELRAFIASYREELANVTAERRKVTDQTIRAQMLGRIGELNDLINWHEKAMLVDPAPQKYGHDRSERFMVPIPGREPIQFSGHMYRTDDIVEKAALEYVLTKDRELRRIADDERPFWNAETNDFHGWDTVNRLHKSGADISKYRTF